MPELAVFKVVKEVHFVNVSFSFPGLSQDSLNRSPWFEYKSTPFCSMHVCGTLVLCYDSNLIVGVSDSPFCHIMHMLIMCCHGEVM